MISVTALEKLVTAWSKKLEKQGYTTEVSALKTGRAAGYGHSPVSRVWLKVEKDGEYVEKITFLANGYGGPTDRDIGGTVWSAMKKEALRRIER